MSCVQFILDAEDLVLATTFYSMVLSAQPTKVHQVLVATIGGR